MNQYKLIKLYPGSPELGYITKFDKNDEDWGAPNMLILTDCSNYPEYWEKIVEKDYEILHFICKEKRGVENAGTILTKKPNGSFWIDHRWTEEAMLRLSHYAIYSVKRLSDGETFTVGDNIAKEKFVTDRKFTTIDEIYFNEHNQLSYRTNDHKVKAPKTFVFNDDTVKHEEPILITEDAVEIFHEGVPVVIYSKLTYGQLYSGLYFKSLHDEFSCTKVLFFAKKENALIWIEENKPQYSEKDMISFGVYARGFHGSIGTKKCFNWWLKSPCNNGI